MSKCIFLDLFLILDNNNYISESIYVLHSFDSVCGFIRIQKLYPNQNDKAIAVAVAVLILFVCYIRAL